MQQMSIKEDIMDKLIELGFEDAALATWRDPDIRDAITIDIKKHSAASNILYAVIFHSSEIEDDIPVKSEVVYIGHTRKTFRNRMNGYQAGCGTAVNNRIHLAIKKHFSLNGTVSVMVLPDRHGLQMNGIHLDVAAGLEYALIDFYCHYNRKHGHRELFNIAGNTCGKKVGKAGQLVEEEAPEKAAEELKEENADYPEPSVVEGDRSSMRALSEDCQVLPCEFSFNLTEKTYWPKPVFNVPVKCDKHIGPHGDTIQVELVGQSEAFLEVVVDRNANQITHSPRVYFGGPNREAYDQWKKANHIVGDPVTVVVIGHNSIQMK
jgi:hypothetical protein